MSDFITIPSKVVTCSDGKKDRYVEINTNPAGAPRVRAFIDMFLGSAESASNNCYGLPVNVILTIWGGESLWAADDVHWTNQNWGNLGYNSSNNPVGNIGKGIGGFAKFEGRNKFAKGFAGFLTYGSNYKDLIDYLKQCQQQSKKPTEDRCFYLIAHGGYTCGAHPASKHTAHSVIISLRYNVRTSLYLEWKKLLRHNFTTFMRRFQSFFLLF